MSGSFWSAVASEHSERDTALDCGVKGDAQHASLTLDGTGNLPGALGSTLARKALSPLTLCRPNARQNAPASRTMVCWRGNAGGHANAAAGANVGQAGSSCPEHLFPAREAGASAVGRRIPSVAVPDPPQS